MQYLPALPSQATLLLLVSYALLLLLISQLRAWTPRIALDDHQMSDVEQKQLLHASTLKHQDLQDQFPTRTPSRDLAITIVTSNRARPYIHAVLGSLAEAYSSDLPSVILCNVESATFPVLDELRKEKWSVVDINKDKSFNTSSLSLRLAKESADYWQCLNLTTRNSQARYTLVLEDDVVVHERFRSIIVSLIYQMDHTVLNVDYTKLYHINRLRGISRWPQMIAVSFLLSSLLHWLFSPRPLHSLIGCLVVLIHLNNQGTTFPADFRFSLTNSVYLTMSESCCMQAVLFRTFSIPAIVDKLSDEKAFNGHAKDHILDESPFVGRETDFNLVSHIGNISSLRRNEP